MKNRILTSIIFTVLLLTFGCSTNKNPIITIETEIGIIKVELYKNKAPVTVNNFLNYVDNKMLNGGEFYRVVNTGNQPENNIKIDVIQGGIGWDDSLPRLEPIKHESTDKTKILHKRGTISMARDMPGTASSEFFICVFDEPELDYGGMRNPDGQGFAAFGKVIEGMHIVEQIHTMPDTNQMLIMPVKILSVKCI